MLSCPKWALLFAVAKQRMPQIVGCVHYSNNQGDDFGNRNISTPLKVIFDAENASNGSQNSTTNLEFLFAELYDSLWVKRFANFPLPGHVTSNEEFKKLLVRFCSKNIYMYTHRDYHSLKFTMP